LHPPWENLVTNRLTSRAGQRQTSAFKSVFSYCLLLFASVLILPAQTDGTSAGGNWREYDSEDKMTAARRVQFELPADNTLRDSRYYQPRVQLFCENGSLKSSEFDPGVRLAPPNRPGFWGQPQMEVRVRVNNSHSNHGWNWNGHSLSMDKGTTREMLGAEVFKIEFLASRSGPQIAEFSPGGINLGRVQKACGLNPKKP
jgi:hypothetical protein